MNLKIIGLTGSLGSGCTYVAQNILSQKDFKRISLTDFLRKEYETEFEKEAPKNRHELQEYGDKLRREKGENFLATKALEDIWNRAKGESISTWVVDSIRNPSEIHFFREKERDFFLFGVYATRDTRWNRVKHLYDDNQRTFGEDDENDTGRKSEQYGQRVEDCFAEADVVFSNEEYYHTPDNQPFQSLKGRVQQFVEVVSNPLTKRQPTPKEALMSVAFALSQRSSCLKRKVGALIVDDEDNIISSGFNEVPRDYRPCRDDFGKCRRDKAKKDCLDGIREDLPAEILEKYPNIAETVSKQFSQNFKNLDICRALHAEENAIINLARNGRSVPLSQCTLYTTTYPCRLCANKIVNLGIKHLIYLEPYPDPEAKSILKSAGTKDEFFEGITFKAFSRVYGEKK